MNTLYKAAKLHVAAFRIMNIQTHGHAPYMRHTWTCMYMDSVPSTALPSTLPGHMHIFSMVSNNSPGHRICWAQVWSRTLSRVRCVRQCTSCWTAIWCGESAPPFPLSRPCCAPAEEEGKEWIIRKPLINIIWNRLWTIRYTFFHASHSSGKSNAAAATISAKKTIVFIVTCS